ncbi:class I SAM-dependent RNA methyltransferase [Euzebya tangerina]|uniref:class I SAM-dependent RNA methyltransferase n=1 Tax=Euzebya tangerina TaxID=591198 RepID=UPI0013C2E969|nr:TRAM domain-containing protein [Euzebya tangerina]
MREPPVEITLDGWAHGGQAVGRLPDGRACFVPRAIPGERVRVAVHTVKKRHAVADLLEVLTPSPHRVDPPCPLYEGCGGCQLQHVDPAHQLALKRRVVIEQLQRLGGVIDPPVADVITPTSGWPAGYRSWARMAVSDGGVLGFRRPRAHTVQPVDECLLLQPDAQQLRERAGDDWAGATEVTLLAGSDGQVVAVTTADPPGEVHGGPADDPRLGIVVDGRVQQPPSSIQVSVHGISLVATAGSFFQAGWSGAEALVEAVLAAVDIRPDDTVADLYAGGGLLSVFLAAHAAHLIAVEADPVAADDARTNLSHADRREGSSRPGHAGSTEVRATTVERWLASNDATVDVVVLDPPRPGAGAEVVRGLLGLEPRQIVYVACDPAALARDTRTLLAGGYALQSVQPLDLFGHTAHVEAVAVFTIADPPTGG